MISSLDSAVRADPLPRRFRLDQRRHLRVDLRQLAVIAIPAPSRLPSEAARLAQLSAIST